MISARGRQRELHRKVPAVRQVHVGSRVRMPFRRHRFHLAADPVASLPCQLRKMAVDFIVERGDHMRGALLLSVAVVLASNLAAQSRVSPSRFEVASVRLVAPDGDRPPAGFAANPRRTGNRLTWTTSLNDLTMYAHNLPGWRVRGMKGEALYVTLAATVDPATTPEAVRAMLKQLLIDRFKLVTHTVSEQRSGYGLMVAKGGSKLVKAAPDGTLPPMPSYMREYLPAPYEGFIFEGYVAEGVAAITGRGVPVSKLAEALSAHLGAFVIDRTSLTGRFYFGFKFQPIHDVSNVPSPAASLFTAVEEELGLKLEKQNGPVEFLVIDSVNRVPIEN